jgi:hypothetical protein
VTVDLCTGGTAAASSGTAAAAFDDNLSNYWAADAVASWIQYQFAIAPIIKTLRMRTASVGNYGCESFPAGFDLLGSNTGAFAGEEVTLLQAGDYVYDGDHWYEYVVRNANSYAYYRIDIYETGGGLPVRIAEIEMLGEGIPVASGGIESIVDGYKIHKFTGDGVFTVTEAGQIEVLVVAAGGGGGFGPGAGGGAGGIVFAAAHGVIGQEYSITVGQGGAGDTNDTGVAANGGNSVFDVITALGGGGGGSGNGTDYGADGGSGGGSPYQVGMGGTCLQYASGGDAGYGYNGGGGVNANGYGAGGGGGSGDQGADAVNFNVGDGGPGREFSQFASAGGSPAGFFGGGGGAGRTGYTVDYGTGGVGGGGDGGYAESGSDPGDDGVANTGGGGGGGGFATSGGAGGAGGSGIVIIRYLYVEDAIPTVAMTLTGHAPTYNVYGVPAAEMTLIGHAPQAGFGGIRISNPADMTLLGIDPTVCMAYPIPEAAMKLLSRNPAYTWSIPLASQGQAQDIYSCILTGSADGIDDIVLPISSFQATMRDGDPSYLSCVIPNSVDYETFVTARTNGEIIIQKGVRLRDGTEQMEEIARVDYESVQINRGPRNDSMTLSGHKTVTSSAPKERAVNGVSFYGLQADGKRRVRANMDLFLRCGDTCIYGDGANDYFVVGMITYWVAARPAAYVMEVQEA